MKTVKRKTKSKATTTASVAEVAELERILAASPSPFSDAVLSNAFRETPDVPSIHASARRQCLDLIREAEGGRTSLQVITGDAGDGKTHLIAWLRRRSEDGWRGGAERYALAVIPPLRSLARVRHHVLQEVVRQLSTRLSGHNDEATDTPIEILFWRALLGIARILAKHRSTSAELRSRLDEVLQIPDRFLAAAVEELRAAWPIIGDAFVDSAVRLPELADVDRDVFRVLSRFPRGDDAMRVAIVDWLGGASLPAERLEMIGAPLVLDEEAEASRGLRSILALARLASTPVALAFDQIEGTIRLGEDAVSAFLDAITELYGDCPGAVLLVFCQVALWPELRGKAALHVRDRLDDSPAIHLKALTPDEALLLVRTRMEHFWRGLGKTVADPLLPLTTEAVQTEIRNGNLRTPRAVIRHFQHFLREPADERARFVPPPMPAPETVIKRKLESLIEEERSGTRPADARAAIAQGVVQDLFHHAATAKRVIGGVSIEAAEPFRIKKTSLAGVRVTLRSHGTPKRVYIEASNSQHGKSAASAMRRMADVLKDKEADQAFLLREAAFPLPPKAKESLLALEASGAILNLEEGEIPTLAAIEALLNAASAGDVPADRPTALDIAVRHISRFAVIEATIGKAFPAVATSIAPPAVSSADPRKDDARATAVIEHLRTVRAFQPATHIAAQLGLNVEQVHLALKGLMSAGLVEVVEDRNQAAVALLRPEGLAG